MARMDFERRAASDRARRNGIDNLADHGIPGGLRPPRPRPLKAAMREELARLMAEFSKKNQRKTDLAVTKSAKGTTKYGKR